MRFDPDIQRDVVDELRWGLDDQLARVTATTRFGIVTLTGVVSTYAARLAAQAAAERIVGVRYIVNDAEVLVPPHLRRSDLEIAVQARMALQLNVTVPARDIRPSVSAGWLTLEGAVKHPLERCAAEQAVEVLAGVRGISNHIQVDRDPRADPTGTAEIDRALRRSAELDCKHIVVEATADGGMFLRGTVRSWAEWREAERATWAAPGVRSVVNRLVVAL